MLLPLMRAAVATSALRPVVNSINPTSGPATGGTKVTINGKNFTGNATVSFGSIAATWVTINSGTSITTTAPAGSGTVDVTVTTPGGTSNKNSADKFTYVPAPVVSSISPTSGPATGGTTVTINGSYLDGAISVYFGSPSQAAKIIYDSNTRITATSPGENPGTVRVHVTTTGGASDPNDNGQNDQYTYIAAPTVTGVTPNQGPLAGGTTVTITGANFISGNSTVYFGSSKASVGAVTSTSITAISPQEQVGTVDVTVTTPGGTSNKSSADYFTFLAAPTVTGVKPNQGPLAGGTTVTIAGTGFVSGNTTVYFGSIAATGVTVNSGTAITATAPAGSGTVDVTVTTKYGTSAANGSDKFSYITIAVYSDSKYSVPWGTGNPSTTAYVKCTGLTPGSLYTLEYEDPGNVVINKDTGCKAAADGTYEAAGFNLTSYTAAKYLGNWTVLLYSAGGSGQTGGSQNCTPQCTPVCSELLASTTFLVNTSNVPEFPAWFTGILVLGLCSGIYFWMRKRNQVRTA